jgi:hypothetical protein
MPLHIDEIQTDVQMDSGDRSGIVEASSKPEPWLPLVQLRALHEELLEACARVSAFGNED